MILRHTRLNPPVWLEHQPIDISFDRNKMYWDVLTAEKNTIGNNFDTRFSRCRIPFIALLLRMQRLLHFFPSKNSISVSFSLIPFHNRRLLSKSTFNFPFGMASTVYRRRFHRNRWYDNCHQCHKFLNRKSPKE